MEQITIEQVQNRQESWRTQMNQIFYKTPVDGWASFSANLAGDYLVQKGFWHGHRKGLSSTHYEGTSLEDAVTAYNNIK